MPNFLVEETTVRECGESPVFSVGESDTNGNSSNGVLLILEITHVRQQQDLDVHIFASEDGVNWPKRPFALSLIHI